VAVITHVKAGVYVSGHDIGLDQIASAIGEHIEPVHVSFQNVASNAIIITGRKQINPVGTVIGCYIVLN
jgi:hypothetical protein